MAVSQTRSFQLWQNVVAAPNSFALDAGAYGVTAHASAWGTATLQRLLPDGSGNLVAVTVLTAFAADGYAEIHLPAGRYQMTLAGVTAFTGEVALLASGSG